MKHNRGIFIIKIKNKIKWFICDDLLNELFKLLNFYNNFELIAFLNVKRLSKRTINERLKILMMMKDIYKKKLYKFESDELLEYLTKLDFEIINKEINREIMKKTNAIEIKYKNFKW